MIQRIPEVELAKQAMQDGKRELMWFYLGQRKRRSNKERALADGHQQSAGQSTHSKDTLIEYTTL